MLNSEPVVASINLVRETSFGHGRSWIYSCSPPPAIFVRPWGVAPDSGSSCGRMLDMARSYPFQASTASPVDATISPPSYVALGLSLALQVPALGLLLLGQLKAGGILIYAVVLLALFYGIIKKNYLNALAIFISSYGLSLPFRDSAAIGWSTYPYAYILIAFFLIFGRRSKSLTKFLPIIFCFFLYWLSWTWGAKPMPYGLSVRLTGATAGMVLTYLAVNQVEDLRFLFWAMLLGSALFIPTVFLFQSPEERFGLLQLADNIEAGNPVSYMGHLAPWMIVGFALVVWDTGLKYRKIIIAGLIILTCVLVYSTSRTNIFLVAIGIMPIILRGFPKRPAFILILLMVIVGGSTIVIVRNPMASHYLIGKLPSLGSAQQGQIVRKQGQDQTLRGLDKYSSGRIYLMRAGIEKFLRSPFAGVGFGNSDVIISTGKGQVIHSFWVKLLAESALLVTLPLLIILLWQFFHYIWRNNGSLPGLSMGLFLGMAVFGLMAHGLDLIMWPMYGLALAVAEMKN